MRTNPAGLRRERTDDGRCDSDVFPTETRQLVGGRGRRVVFSTSNIDGLVKYQGMDLMFQHAPTFIERVEFSEAVPGSDLFTNVTVSDLDGLDRVVCAFSLYGQDDALLTQSVLTAGPEGVFVNELSYRYPLTVAAANTTLSASINCMDNLQQSFVSNASVEVMAAELCENCTKDGEDVQRLPTILTPTTVRCCCWLASWWSSPSPQDCWCFVGVVRPMTSSGPQMSWSRTPIQKNCLNRTKTKACWRRESPALPDIVPEGWSLEDYRSWLDGPLPEGWTEEQWRTYVEESKATLSAVESKAEG